MDTLSNNIMTVPTFGNLVVTGDINSPSFENLVVTGGSNIITYDANHTIPTIPANESMFDQMIFGNSHVTGPHKLTNIKYEADLTVEGSFTVEGTDIILKPSDKNNDVNLKIDNINKFLDNNNNGDKLKLIHLLSKMCDKIKDLENEITELKVNSNLDNINISI